jgi:hypothetical protein
MKQVLSGSMNRDRSRGREKKNEEIAKTVGRKIYELFGREMKYPSIPRNSKLRGKEAYTEED